MSAQAAIVSLWIAALLLGGVPGSFAAATKMFPADDPSGTCGYIDQTGRVVIPLAFDACGPFSEELAEVRMKERWGYIDLQGRFVIKPQFAVAYPFSKGFALTQNGDTIRYINHAGQAVLTRSASACKPIDDFHDGLMLCTAQTKYGYLDQTGKMIIAAQFDDARRFSDGLAAVAVDQKWGYIDRTGRIVIEPQNFDAAYEFSEELALVTKGVRDGYLNRTGDFAISPQFFGSGSAVEVTAQAVSRRKIGSFSEGLAAVRIGSSQGKWGYIDKTGKVIIEPRYESAGNFEEGMARVKSGHAWGYINRTGRFVIEPQFADACDFADGLARVLTHPLAVSPSGDVEQDAFNQMLIAHQGTWGYIDSVGRYVWPPAHRQGDGAQLTHSDHL